MKDSGDDINYVYELPVDVTIIKWDFKYVVLSGKVWSLILIKLG